MPFCVVSIPPWFNFATHYGTGMTKIVQRFNPTLVRFCPILPSAKLTHSSVSIPPWFDFARPSARLVAALVASFQSHLGSILPVTNSPAAPSPTQRFNPTLVRFCPLRKARSHILCYRFNPTLVRFCPITFAVLFQRNRRFNPTLVRFCRARFVPGPRGGRWCFNPTLVRFCLILRRDG